MGKWEDESDEMVYMDTMHCTDTTLAKVNLPPNAGFVLSDSLYVQLNSSSLEWYANSGFIILDVDSVEIIWAR